MPVRAEDRCRPSMSDPIPPRPDQPSWIMPSPQPVHVPSRAPDRPGRTPALMAAAFVASGLVFVLGLPVIGRIGGSTTHVHVSLPDRRVDRARFPDAASSDQLSLRLDSFDALGNCEENTVNGLADAYASDCVGWSGVPDHSEVFQVLLASNSDQPIEWSLDQLVLQSTRGRLVQPLPPFDRLLALPDSGTLQPHDVVSGLVAFDTGKDFIPQSMLYEDQDDLVVDVSGS
jgi:hypothetical protein